MNLPKIKNKEQEPKYYSLVLMSQPEWNSESYRYMWTGVEYSLENALAIARNTIATDNKLNNPSSLKLETWTIRTVKTILEDLISLEENDKIDKEKEKVKNIIGSNEERIELKNKLIQVIIDSGDERFIEEYKHLLTINEIKLIKNSIKQKYFK